MDILNEIKVTILRQSGTDRNIAEAAWVSLEQHYNPSNQDIARIPGLLNTLLKKKHGSPFEHNSITLHVEAPIFVFREFMRHRIGFSYNEMSARYTEMPDRFYTPGPERPVVNAGTSMNPNYVPGTEEQFRMMTGVISEAYWDAWESYQSLLKLGIAKELARVVLPVGIMSQMVVTMNARSLMSFLMLRVDSEDNTFPTKPQYEIQKVAEQMEDVLKAYFPLTHEAFVKNGRVAP